MKKLALVLALSLSGVIYAQEVDPTADAPTTTTTQSTVTNETDTEWVLSYRYGPTYMVNGKPRNDFLGATVTKITIVRHLVDGKEIKRDTTRETRNVTNPLKTLFTNAATNTMVVVAGPGKVNRHDDAPARLFNNSAIPAE